MAGANGMKIKTSELEGIALDWAVGKTLGLGDETLDPITWMETAHPSRCYSYSTDWSQGGPIIEHACIGLDHYPDDHPQGGEWGALTNEGTVGSFGPTPLVAAMRCYVASKLGDEVDVPDELTK